ncbi:hypothetical protein EJA72_16515 [Pseudomonas sp. PB120]|nr:hypothetical protein [Pseudomonas sp. PB120]
MESAYSAGCREGLRGRGDILPLSGSCGDGSGPIASRLAPTLILQRSQNPCRSEPARDGVRPDNTVPSVAEPTAHQQIIPPANSKKPGLQPITAANPRSRQR